MGIEIGVIALVDNSAAALAYFAADFVLPKLVWEDDQVVLG